MKLCAIVSPLLFLSLVSLTGCVLRDHDALQAKMLDCNIAPAMPLCAYSHPLATGEFFDDPDVNESFQTGFRRGLDDIVDSQAEQDCVLAVNCSDNDDSSEIIGECISLENNGSFDRDCIPPCTDEFEACGEENDCGVDVVNGCIDDFYACRDSCRTSLF